VEAKFKIGDKVKTSNGFTFKISRIEIGYTEIFYFSRTGHCYREEHLKLAAEDREDGA